MFQTINQIYRACSPEIPLWNLQEVQGFSIAMVWPGDRVMNPRRNPWVNTKIIQDSWDLWMWRTMPMENMANKK